MYYESRMDSARYTVSMTSKIGAARVFALPKDIFEEQQNYIKVIIKV